MSSLPVAALDELVQETFALWDVTRVGFSWRHYYLNHTNRVKDLSVCMARRTGADADLLECAGILHDITKRYDGEMLKDAGGKTVVNEEGFWLNETLDPARGNWVTEMYDRMDLRGTVHHLSGAVLTQAILAEYGVDADVGRDVAEIVRGHLKPSNLTEAELLRIYRLPESRLLYDADTIDPNLGLSAFYRNIQINAGFALRQGREMDLRDYVGRIPGWVNSKDAFVEQMLSDAGREVAADRQTHNRWLCSQIEMEMADFELNARYGVLGAIACLMTRPEDPSFHHHAQELRDQWLPARADMLAEDLDFSRDNAAHSLERARKFSSMIDQTIRGEI